MNQINLFLYLSEVVGNLGVVLRVFCGIGGIAFCILLFATLISYSDASRYYASNAQKEAAKNCKYYLFKFFWAMLFLIVLTVLTPSQQTLQLIAASQVSETVVTTPEAKEILSKVGKIVNLQLDKLTKE